MGEPQSRKRKFKNANAKSNNNEVKDVELTTVDTNSEIKKVKTKKAKKNKSTEKPVDNNSVDSATEASPMKNKAEISNTSVDESELKVKTKKNKKAKKNKATEPTESEGTPAKKAKTEDASESSASLTRTIMGGLTEEMVAKYPVLKDEELVKKFMAVPMSNNQKGRIRLALRVLLKGTSESMLPEAIHTKLQAILKSPEPTEADLRRVRILYNMLRTAVKGKPFHFMVKKEELIKKKKNKKSKEDKKENGTEDETEDAKDKKPEQKVKGPKRYVVFVGNLPLDISKEKVLEHFSELSGHIKDVRIPKPLENKKSAIAYLEVKDDVGFELALSKHHSMLGNKRINVLYSTQKNSKISKAEAKGKAAKLVAMQKSGQLAGSVPLDKKRSARRKKMKLAQKKAQAASE